jgi:hypothetical protein
MKAGTKLSNTQLVWLRGRAHEKGAEFVVSESPKDGTTPVEVDGFTAGRWCDERWAQVVAPKSPKAQ